MACLRVYVMSVLFCPLARVLAGHIAGDSPITLLKTERSYINIIAVSGVFFNRPIPHSGGWFSFCSSASSLLRTWSILAPPRTWSILVPTGCKHLLTFCIIPVLSLYPSAVFGQGARKEETGETFLHSISAGSLSSLRRGVPMGAPADACKHHLLPLT